MKRNYIIMLGLLFVGNFVSASERRAHLYKLPHDHVLNKKFKEAGLEDFAKNSKLIENLKRASLYPDEIGYFIQLAYADYFRYLDSYNPTRNIHAMNIPVSTNAALILNVATQSDLGLVALIGKSYWEFNYIKALNKVLEKRNQIYEILLHQYPSELVRLEDIGIYNSFHTVSSWL